MIPELKTFLIAMSPIIELRGAIPIAISVYKLPPASAYLFSVLGNLVPLTLIILLLDPISKFLSGRYIFFNKIFSWLFSYTRNAHLSKADKFGKELAVLIMIATPIPLIGGWTGAIAAFVFGLSFGKAFPLVVLGTMISGLLVVLISLGVKIIF